MIALLKAKLAGARKSWTAWFNGLTLIIVPLLPMAADSLPQLQPYVPDNLFKYAMLVVLVANLALRFKTKTALQDK